MVSGTVPLSISGVTSANITASSVDVTWKTNGAATSQIFYDTATHNNVSGYPNHTAIDNTLVSNHTHGITGLQANTTYFCRAQSTISGLTAVSDEFTFQTLASGGGGGGGGGGGAPITGPILPGVTVVASMVNKNGVFTQGITALSDDDAVVLRIEAGTVSKTADGSPLTQITIAKMKAPPDPPAGVRVISTTYEFGPVGTTFNPPVVVKIPYDSAKIPGGVSEDSLAIGYYDSIAKTWYKLISVVDPANHAVTAQVEHFAPLAVMSGLTATAPPPAPPTTPATTTPTAAPTTPTAAPTTPPPTTVPTSQPTTPTQAPAAFILSELAISPAEVDAGGSVTVSILATNTGDLAGTYQVILSIDGAIVATKTLNLAGRTKEMVSFDSLQDVAGQHTIDVNGLSGTIIVRARQSAQPPPTNTTLWIIVGVSGFISSFLTTTIVAWRKIKSSYNSEYHLT